MAIVMSCMAFNAWAVSVEKQLGESKPEKIQLAQADSKSRKSSSGANADAIWEAARNSTQITEGEGEKEMFVFFDPFCPHCHTLWKKTRPYLSQAKIHWIPLGDYTPESMPAAEGLLKGGTVQDLTAMMGDFKMPIYPRDTLLRQKINANKKAFLKTGSSAYPTVLFGAGEKRKNYPGAPSEDALKKMFLEN